MRTLPNRTIAPPGGWRFKVPQTGVMVRSSNLDGLLLGLRDYYAANRLEKPSNLPELIEEQICADDPSYCSGVAAPSGATSPKAPSISFSALVQGTRFLASFLRRGRPLVERELANERAAICVDCPENIPASGCSGCNAGALRQVIERIVGGRATTSDSRLTACRICECSLKAKVHVPIDLILENTSKKQMDRLRSVIASKQQDPTLPGFKRCWIVQESRNEDDDLKILGRL